MTAVPPARILETNPTDYHKLPGFSASLAKILIARCPLVARDAYERQVEDAADDESETEEAELESTTPEKRKNLDRGNVLHALVLGVGKRVDLIPNELLAKNGALSTKEGKAYATAAREAGRIPVKAADMEVYGRAATAIRARLGDAGIVLDGISELAIEWHESVGGTLVQCRSMLDHVILCGDPPRSAIIYDLKICGDAAPDRQSRTAESLGYGLQYAAYTSALNALYPTIAGRIEFRFLFCEPRRPYAIWTPTPAGPFRALAEQRWRRALVSWARGLSTGAWPGYRDVNEIDAPMWALKQEGFLPEEM